MSPRIGDSNILQKVFRFGAQRTLHTTAKWELAYALRHRRKWEKDCPAIPEMEQFSQEYLRKEKYNLIEPITPVWQSRRAPLMGYKVGVLPLWDEWGERHAVTVVKVDRLRVLEKHSIDKHGQEGMKTGMGKANIIGAPKAQIGEAMKLGVGLKDIIESHRCSSDCILPVGFSPKVRHFTPGQWVMVGALTRHTKFQGAIQRWKFQDGRKGMTCSNKVVRSRGATGTGGDGLVHRGLKMAGHAGGLERTVLCKVFRIESIRNLLFLRGITPGGNGAKLTIWDARGIGWVRNKNIDIPWPTFIPEANVEYPTSVQCPPPHVDPFVYYERAFNDKKR